MRETHVFCFQKNVGVIPFGFGLLGQLFHELLHQE